MREKRFLTRGANGDRFGLDIMKMSCRNVTMTIIQSLAHGLNAIMLYDAATPYLTIETVLLTAVNGTKGICLERAEIEEPIRYS